MRAIGIDLGTTNSVAACCDSDPRSPRVLANSSGENLTPSVVGVRRRKDAAVAAEFLVGRAAVNYAPSAPENTVFSIKRLMGHRYADPKVAELRERYSYEIVEGSGDDPRAHVRVDGTVYAPAEISAMILRRIKADAERVLGEPVTHAVITIPAYFNDSQRAATREAGELAGLVVKKIIDEPTAAAFAFGLHTEPGSRHRILVFDLGGGTFDISILQMVKKDGDGHDQFQVLETSGDKWLGGDDFDRAIVDRVIAWVKEETGEDPSTDKRFLLLARKFAEEAKRALSQAEETDIVIPAAYRTALGEMQDVEMNLTRTQFEAMIRGSVGRCTQLVQEALAKQGLTPADISDVLLVGGSTLVPLVSRSVEAVFGAANVRRTVNPMECVALGAAIVAATQRGIECASCKTVNDEAAVSCVKCEQSLAGARAVGDTGLQEVTAMALGIAAVKGNQADVFVPIIKKGTPYPLREPMRATLKATDGRRIRVPVYEGDEPVASSNHEQGVIEYELPEEIDVDTPVEVSFNYDRNREVTVTVRVLGTSLFKTETLRRDRATTAPAPTRAEASADWRDELTGTVEFAQSFLDHYAAFMEPHQSMKLQRDVERAQRLLASPADQAEGPRMDKIVYTAVMSCGVATQLYLADRATDGAPPEIASKINQSATLVRQSYETGDRARAAEQARLLKVLVAQTLKQRQAVGEIGDRTDFKGLLRLLEG